MKAATLSPRGARRLGVDMKEMEFLNAVLPINGNSSYLLKLVQETVNSSFHWWTWLILAFGSVATHILGAFGEMFWIIFFLWAMDMFLGNLRALVDESIPWSVSKSLDGVLRLIAYGVLGTTLRLIELFVLESTGADIDGLLLGGGYTICALGEVRSLVKHFTYFIPGFSVFGDKIIKILKTATGGNGKKLP